MMRTCQTDGEWATALALWPLGRKSELCVHREPIVRMIIVIVAKRERKRETREEERREKRRERRSRVYVENVLVCTFKTPVSFVTRAF